MTPLQMITRSKIADVLHCLEHMKSVDDQQQALSTSHPEIYSGPVHLECLVANFLFVSAGFVDVLSGIATEVDGSSPQGELPGKNLVHQLSVDTLERPLILDEETSLCLQQVFQFRRMIYEGMHLRHDQIHEALDLLDMTFGLLSKDLAAFFKRYRPIVLLS